jgi:phage shock protein A
LEIFMGILKRLIVMMKSQLNYLIGKGEDPEKMLNQLLFDMQEQLISAKRQVALSIADERKLKIEFERENSISMDWEKKAILALRAKKEDLARMALERKSEHDKISDGFERQWSAQKKSVDKLKYSLQTLTNKIGAAKRKKNLLIARSKRANAQKTISSTMSEISSNTAISSLDRMEDNIKKLEADAYATVELAREASEDELDKKFSSLKMLSNDDAIAKLKRKILIDRGKIKNIDKSIINKIENDVKKFSK